MEFLKFKKIFDKISAYSTNDQNEMPVFVKINNIKYAFTFDIRRFDIPNEYGNINEVVILIANNSDLMCLYDVCNALESISNRIKENNLDPTSFNMNRNYEVDYIVNCRYDTPNDSDFTINEELIISIDERDFG